jgi:hypothetical protein
LSSFLPSVWLSVFLSAPIVLSSHPSTMVSREIKFGFLHHLKCVSNETLIIFGVDSFYQFSKITRILLQA